MPPCKVKSAFDGPPAIYDPPLDAHKTETCPIRFGSPSAAFVAQMISGRAKADSKRRKMGSLAFLILALISDSLACVPGGGGPGVPL